VRNKFKSGFSYFRENASTGFLNKNGKNSLEKWAFPLCSAKIVELYFGWEKFDIITAPICIEVDNGCCSV